MGKDERFDLPVLDNNTFDMNATTGLLSLDWSKDLVDTPGTVPVLTAGALVGGDSELPPDHLVTFSCRFVRLFESTR